MSDWDSVTVLRKKQPAGASRAESVRTKGKRTTKQNGQYFAIGYKRDRY
jgi:hypothetical protein